MITRQIWKRLCFNLFTSIMYLQLIDLKIWDRLIWCNRPDWYLVMTLVEEITPYWQGLKNPLVISTFGLAEIISCMPDGLVKIYIGYWQTCQHSRIYLYSCMLFNQQQCFIYSTASFLSKLRAKKVEKLCNSS